MDDFTLGILFLISMFSCMLLFVFLGNQFSIYQATKYPELKHSKNKIIEASIFALMGLLIAFTFSGARERFDVRRALVIDEANAIKVVYLRLDLLPSTSRANIQNAVKAYLNKRLEIYKKMPHIDHTMPELKQSEILEQQIWSSSVQSCQTEKNSAACIVLLPAINHMIDIANTRFESTRIHPPSIILVTLISLAFLSAILSGYSLDKDIRWCSVHTIIFSAIIAFTIFIIVNLEYPYLGFIPIDYFNDVLIDLSNNL